MEVYCIPTGTVISQMKASTFDSNTAISSGDDSGGGVLYSLNCTLTMKASEFDNNTATTNGNGGGGGVLYSEECIPSQS